MRAVVAVTGDPSEWFDSIDDIRQIRRDLIIIKDQVLLVSDAKARRNMQARIAEIHNSTVRGMLSDFIQTIPISDATAEADTDFQLGPSSEDWSTFDKLIDEVSLEDLVEERNRGMKVGDSRDKSFDRIFQPILPYVRSITLTDPYTGSAIWNMDSNRLWLLRKFLSLSNVSVNIFTTIPRDENRSRTDAEWASQVEDRFGRLCREINFVGKARVELFKPKSSIFHHRRILFEFEKSNISRQLDKGIEGFARDPIPEASALTPLQYADFANHLLGIRHNLETVKVIQVDSR